MGVTDNPAIVGAGTTSKFGELTNRTRLSLAAEALGNALDDAGLSKDELDGIVMNMGSPLATHYDRLCEALGLDVRFVDQKWAHGRWVGMTLMQAAMAVEVGIADYVAAGLGMKFNAIPQVGGGVESSLSEIGSLSEHFERPWYGMTAPVAGNALATRYYMERYGADSKDLAHVAKTLRDHASMDPRSHYSQPFTLKEHQESRLIVDPLRLFDCAAVSDGGAYVIVTSAEKAESVSNTPAHIVSMEGMHAGRNEYLFSWPGMGIRTHDTYDYDASVVDHVYEQANVTRDDIDALYTYDAFSSNIWYTLERWGFCDPGTAYEFTRNGSIGIEGDLPVNTHGGLLSNGHISGWNHMVEMYNQLLGRCDERQIADADTVQWGTPFGDSIILRRA